MVQISQKAFLYDNQCFGHLWVLLPLYTQHNYLTVSHCTANGLQLRSSASRPMSIASLVFFGWTDAWPVRIWTCTCEIFKPYILIVCSFLFGLTDILFCADIHLIHDHPIRTSALEKQFCDLSTLHTACVTPCLMDKWEATPRDIVCQFKIGRILTQW